ncbi:MAG: amidohydrolase [Capsulimonadales bacterium]|nr:amidohydrolase [Capsulimonadales bacterium]
MLSADLIAIGGNVRVGDSAGSLASAFAVRDGKFVAVGADAEILPLAGPNTVRLDLTGKTVTPGFCDSHLHLAWFANDLTRTADLVGCRTVDEILMRLSEHADRYDGPWIRGHGFDQDKMPQGAFPTRADLDRVSRARPIVISRVCGHAAVANSVAIERLTPEERDAGDTETGLFTEGSISAFYRRIPPLSEAEEEAAVLRAARLLLRTGITSVGTLLDTPDQMGIYARLRRKGRLPLRVTGMPPYASIAGLHERGVNTTFGDEWLRFGGAKLFSDGSLGARTALLSAPYSDIAGPPDGEAGIRIYDPEDLKAKTADAQRRGFQIVIHAIGDQAVRETVTAIEQALGPEGDNTWHRHRIEHVSLLPPDLLERMAQRRILAVVQPQFVTSDTWTGERVGAARHGWAYPFRSMLQAGIPLALSSDCPVEKPDAFACLTAAIFRHPWSSGERLTPEEALRAYCHGSHYALHQEDRLGTIEAGKLADFVVLPADPCRLTENELRSLSVDAVYVGGKRSD